MASELGAADIEDYYLRIIADSLKRLLVPSDSVEVGVKRSGKGRSGRASYSGYVRILRWDPLYTPLLLQNISVLDERIRRTVAVSVLLEHTSFGGLWFQVTQATQDAPDQLVGLPPEPMIHASAESLTRY